MKTHTCAGIVMLVLVAALASACSAATPTAEATRAAEVKTPGDVAAPAATPMPTPAPGRSGSSALPSTSYRPNRLIVKNAELPLLVEDSDVAIDRLTQIVGDVGGYILSSRVWYQDWLDESYKYASVTLGVPVDQFEPAMRRLRGLAVKVVNETASGQDVTDEYVDLESRLRNLQATRDRIRDFLNQAANVEEALKVNEQLAAVEAEIETVQGRMNYLFDRAGYSTITVQLDPELPPAPTAPTPTPTPTPGPWSATRVAEDAGKTLTSILRVLAELAIWFSIVVLPFALPPLLIVVGVRQWSRRKPA